MDNTVGEIFCGAGGLALAGEFAGMHHLWGIDNNRWAAATMKRNLGTPGVVQDARTVDYSRLPRVNGIMFGFPCNDYSVVGEHKGLDGDYGPLYMCGVRAIEAHRPDWFLAENVGGITSANGGKAFERILADLESAGDGYDLVPHLYRFEQYGVAQTRHRVITIGIRKALGVRFEVPMPTTGDYHVTARQALHGVESVEANNERTKMAAKTIELLTHIPPGENAWYGGIPKRLRLNVKEDGYRMSGIYRRLHPDRPSPTVTARGGGGTHGYHWDEPRALTNRERARIQSFPDWFVFEGPKEEVRAQIGMAVPPVGAAVILRAVRHTLEGIRYESTAARWAA